MKKILLSAFLFISGLSQAQVPNDDCATPLEIPVNTGMSCGVAPTITLTAATASPQLNTCGGTADDDVWVVFYSTQAKHRLTLTTSPEILPDLRATLYTGCSGSNPPVCLELSNGVANLYDLVPYTYYYIRLYTQADTPQTANVSVCITTIPPVIIETNYTAQQIVQDVLINTPCVQVSNISTLGGSNFNQPVSLGVFNIGNAEFPFERGIILSTGSVAAAVGPNTTVQSNNSQGWPHDTELETLLGDGYSYDATILEFDFVPVIDNISFDYLFASEEYGMYQCTFGDAFAFILTDVTTGVKTNLAVVPGTAIPVSVTTINNSIYNTQGGQCASQNPEYFGAYYGEAPASLTAPVNFNGVTVPMTAQSAVVPGNPYHIKLVIANKMDHAFNSAVFIDAGSFNIGGLSNANIDMSSSEGNMICPGSSTTLSINVASSFNFAWFKDGVVIPDANQSTFVVNEPGTYTVHVTIPGSDECGVEFSIAIYFGESVNQVNVADYWIYETQSDGVTTFFFQEKIDEIENLVEEFELLDISFHLTMQDAETGLNPLPLLYTNTQNPQPIFARIGNLSHNCYSISSFKIGVVDENYIAPVPTGNTNQSFTEGETLADIELEGENIQWYDNPGNGEGRSDMDTDDEPLPLTTPLVDGETYYATQTLFGRESIERLPVTVHLMLGTDENQLTQLKFYPNPVTDVLTLTNTDDIVSFEVYSLVGQVVRSGANTGNTMTVNMADMAPGVYLVKVYTGKQARTVKVVKN